MILGCRPWLAPLFTPPLQNAGKTTTGAPRFQPHFPAQHNQQPEAAESPCV